MVQVKSTSQYEVYLHDNINIDTRVNVAPHAYAPGFAEDENSIFKVYSNLKYGNRLRLSISLQKDYVKYYGLVKGLLEFNQSGRYQFIGNFIDKSFALDLHIDDVSKLKELFSLVNERVEEELRFKSDLKIVIEMEKRHKQELSYAYHNMISYRELILTK